MQCDTLVKGTEFQAETLPAKQAKGGRPALRILVLQALYTLSDDQTECGSGPLKP